MLFHCLCGTCICSNCLVTCALSSYYMCQSVLTFWLYPDDAFMNKYWHIQCDSIIYCIGICLLRSSVYRFCFELICQRLYHELNHDSKNIRNYCLVNGIASILHLVRSILFQFASWLFSKLFISENRCRRTKRKTCAELKIWWNSYSFQLIAINWLLDKFVFIFISSLLAWNNYMRFGAVQATASWLQNSYYKYTSIYSVADLWNQLTKSRRTQANQSHSKTQK